MTTNNFTVNVNTNSITVTLNTAITHIIPADSKLILDGSGGDTYLIYDSASAKVQLFVDGVKNAEWG